MCSGIAEQDRGQNLSLKRQKTRACLAPEAVKWVKKAAQRVIYTGVLQEQIPACYVCPYSARKEVHDVWISFSWSSLLGFSSCVNYKSTD